MAQKYLYIAISFYLFIATLCAKMSGVNEALTWQNFYSIPDNLQRWRLEKVQFQLWKVEIPWGPFHPDERTWYQRFINFQSIMHLECVSVTDIGSFQSLSVKVQSNTVVLNRVAAESLGVTESSRVATKIWIYLVFTNKLQFGVPPNY